MFCIRFLKTDKNLFFPAKQTYLFDNAQLFLKEFLKTVIIVFSISSYYCVYAMPIS